MYLIGNVFEGKKSKKFSAHFIRNIYSNGLVCFSVDLFLFFMI